MAVRRGKVGLEVVSVTDDYEGYGELDEVKRQDWGDPADVQLDPDDLRDGGPTRTAGAVTTTGGTGGPARRPRPTPPPGRKAALRRQTGDQPAGKVSPTTTGDATSGGMHSPDGVSTSDATTGAESTTGGRAARKG
jgi:hypothetical protein